MTLEEKLSQIYESRCDISVSTACWDWISQKFIETMNNIEDFTGFSKISIVFHRLQFQKIQVSILINGKTIESLQSPFSLGAVCICKRFAMLNGIKYECVQSMTPSVSFTYEI